MFFLFLDSFNKKVSKTENVSLKYMNNLKVFLWKQRLCVIHKICIFLNQVQFVEESL